MSKMFGLTVLVAALGMGGCATTSTSPGVASANDCAYIDCMQMAAVEHVANQHGVNVVWLNPPRRD